MVNLKNIRREFPSAGAAIARLESLLSKAQGSHAEYSLEYLYEKVHPDSLSVMADLLSWLTENRFMERVFRVTSPVSGSGLKDFSSFREIPDHILDEVDTGEEIEITDKNIEVLYRLR